MLWLAGTQSANPDGVSTYWNSLVQGLTAITMPSGNHASLVFVNSMLFKLFFHSGAPTKKPITK